MSYVILRRRAEMVGRASDAEGRFSLQGNHRNTSSVVNGYTNRNNSSMYANILAEDASLFKRATMSNAAMLARRFPKRAVTVDLELNFSHGDYLAHVKRARLARCGSPPPFQPQPAVYGRAKGRSVETALRNCAAPAARTGAASAAERYAGPAAACLYAHDVYSKTQQRAARSAFTAATSTAYVSVEILDAVAELALDAVSAAADASDEYDTYAASTYNLNAATDAALEAAQQALQVSSGSGTSADAAAALSLANGALSAATAATAAAADAVAAAIAYAGNASAAATATANALVAAQQNAAVSRAAAVAAAAYAASFA